MRSRGEVEGNFSFIGGFGGGEVNTGMMFVSLKEPRDRPVDEKAGHRLSQQELMDVVRGATTSIPGIRAALVDPSQQGFSASRGGGFPIELSIRGRDWNALAGYSRQIMEEMAQTGKVTDVNSDYQVGMPEVRVDPRPRQGRGPDVSMADIGQTVNAAIGGTRVGKFKEGGRRFDIRVRLLGPQRAAAGGHQRPVRARGRAAPWCACPTWCRIEQQPTLQAITRKDRERAITIFGNVAPGRVAGGRHRGRPRASRAQILPEGYRAIPSGSSQAFQESFDSLRFAFVLGLIVAYMVLAAQFNAFSHPLTVLLALPFSISGALLMLWAFGQSMNVYSMLGLILLMGIAKKNSIMLVDFTNQIRERGRGAPRGHHAGLPDPAAADPHDLHRHHRGRHPARPGPGRGRGDAAAHGHRPHRRDAGVHGAHALRGAGLLQPARRRGRVERAAAAARHRPRGRPARPAPPPAAPRQRHR